VEQWNRVQTQQHGPAEDAGRGQFLDIERELAGLGTAGPAAEHAYEAGEETLSWRQSRPQVPQKPNGPEPGF